MPANIDATKLERAAFIGAASAWYLANLSAADLPMLHGLLERRTLERTAALIERRDAATSPEEKKGLEDLHRWYEAGAADSVSRFVPLAADDRARQARFLSAVDALVGRTVVPERALTAPERIVYVRCPTPKGPLGVFGFDYLKDRLGRERFEALALNSYEGERGGGAEYALELLSFIDGRRSAGDITSLLSAEFGPVPLGHVVEYLDALREVGIAAESASSCRR